MEETTTHIELDKAQVELAKKERTKRVKRYRICMHGMNNLFYMAYAIPFLLVFSMHYAAVALLLVSFVAFAYCNVAVSRDVVRSGEVNWSSPEEINRSNERIVEQRMFKRNAARFFIGWVPGNIYFVLFMGETFTPATLPLVAYFLGVLNLVGFFVSMHGIEETTRFFLQNEDA